MKKRWIVLLLLVCMIACLPKSNPSVEAEPRPTPAVLIGNYTYYWTGLEVKELPEGGYSGRIGSVVPATAMPTHKDEANVGSPDAPYIYLDDGVALLLDGQWIFFRPE